MLEAEPGEPRFPVCDTDCVEPGGLEVTGHPVGDDVVVLDDQDFGGHGDWMMDRGRSTGGRQRVTGW